jgi:TolB-like protein
MSAGLITRLRERGVLRVAASYAVIAWLVLQIADVALEPWNLPDWVRRAPLVIALIGFPIAITLAWFFELGPQGATRDVAPDGAARPVTTGWRKHADIALISVLGAIVAFFVLRDVGWLGQPARPVGAVESTSLAVMPFANVGVATDAYLSEGLSDELRSQFSRMHGLSVIARSSSMAFKEQSLDAVAIAGKLAVATLLEGTVGRERGRIRASVQLVDGKSGRVLWAERYDRADKDLLAVQSDIAGAVVRAVLPRFSASQQAAPSLPTTDPVAYDLYLLGQQKLLDAANAGQMGDDAGSANAAAEAEQLFRSAIAADPQFAQAHATLA